MSSFTAMIYHHQLPSTNTFKSVSETVIRETTDNLMIPVRHRDLQEIYDSYFLL